MPPAPPQTPRINRKLNLVLPLDDTSRGTIYIHAQPISLEVFELHFEVISQAFGNMAAQGRGAQLVGPRTAAMHIRRAADNLGRREEVDSKLFPEIERLTSVVAADKEHGWRPYPYYEARTWLDDEDRSAVENAVAFFIVNSAVVPKSQIRGALGLMGPLLAAQITSSSSTEFASSLQTSTPVETTEERAA